MLARSLLVVAVYTLLFLQVHKHRKTGSVISIIVEIVSIAAAVTLLVAIPALFARSVGIITEKISYLYIIEVNIILGVLLSAVIYFTRYISSGFSKVIFLLSFNTIFFINCLSIAVLYFTGFEIGPTVLMHFSWDAVKVGLLDSLAAFIVIVIVVVLANYYLLKIVRNHKDTVVNYSVVSLVAISIVLNLVVLNFDLYKTKAVAPLISMTEMVLMSNRSDIENRIREYDALEVDVDERRQLEKLGIDLDALSVEPRISLPEKPRNIITIYLESYQLNFTRYRDELFPGLTPNINALSDDYVIFTNFINSVTPTINAMISSQCGMDMRLSEQSAAESNEMLEKDRNLTVLLGDNNRLVCLSDYLHKAGYYQVFMKGASIGFSGKGPFLRKHNYDEAQGKAELDADGRYKEFNSWGLNDPDLFDEALKQLKKLEARQPFNLTMLTVNSHIPGYEFSGCPVYKQGSSILNGIHCTDFALGDFLRKLEKTELYKNTVILIVGDHVMFNALQVSSLFEEKIPLSWYGRTFMAIRSPDETQKQSLDKMKTAFGITPDLAPTILDLLDLDGYRFVAGRSMLGERANYQRIVTSNFEIDENGMQPEKVDNYENPCSIKDAARVRIDHSESYNECQRAKIYHLQQKQLLR